jgi:hypothetical protein
MKTAFGPFFLFSKKKTAEQPDAEDAKGIPTAFQGISRINAVSKKHTEVFLYSFLRLSA